MAEISTKSAAAIEIMPSILLLISSDKSNLPAEFDSAEGRGFEPL